MNQSRYEKQSILARAELARHTSNDVMVHEVPLHRIVILIRFRVLKEGAARGKLCPSTLRALTALYICVRHGFRMNRSTMKLVKQPRNLNGLVGNDTNFRRRGCLRHHKPLAQLEGLK